MQNLKDWVSDNVMNMDKGSHDVAWCDIWAITCYCLWNWKNKELHESNFVRPSNPVQHVIKLCDDYKKAKHINGMVFQHNRVMTNIGWKPPKDQFVKLNVDGASNNGKQAGCGGVIRVLVIVMLLLLNFGECWRD
jgi:hypothetical protein